MFPCHFGVAGLTGRPANKFWERFSLLLLLVALTGCLGLDSNRTVTESPWQEVPAILARIKPPVFPAHDFLITEYGAVGDGVTDCTTAFAAAMTACNAAGGGRVVVPPGCYLTGPIHLQSQVNLHVGGGATIRFTTNLNAYLPPVFTRFECIELMNFSPPIYALGQSNVAITGTGTLDGKGQMWHRWLKEWDADIQALVAMGRTNLPVHERVFGIGHKLRPNFIQPVRCQNVLIEGVRIVNSPMWTLHPLYCTNVTIRGVTVETEGPNTDGCDPDSCTDVWIKDCVFSNGDDCIAVKSGRDEDGQRIGIPCENVVIQDCVFRNGHGGVTMGSETAGGIRNVFAERCQFDSPDLNMAMRFKTNPARGGFIENIFLRDCEVKTAQFGIHLTKRYGAGVTKDGETDPPVRNIEIRNCRFSLLSRQAVYVQGFGPEKVISDVRIVDCTFTPMLHPVFMTNAVNIQMQNCRGLGAGE